MVGGRLRRCFVAMDEAGDFCRLSSEIGIGMSCGAGESVWVSCVVLRALSMALASFRKMCKTWLVYNTR